MEKSTADFLMSAGISSSSLQQQQQLRPLQNCSLFLPPISQSSRDDHINAGNEDEMPVHGPDNSMSMDRTPVQARLFDYRGQRVAGFEIPPNRQLICLPQLYELFLKGFVGGLHTVYTKLKRLDIQPLVCNVDQVRALRSLGAIQPGVNRCKLIETVDFETLYEDCTNSSIRHSRPSKLTPSRNIITDGTLAMEEWNASKNVAVNFDSLATSASHSSIPLFATPSTFSKPALPFPPSNNTIVTTENQAVSAELLSAALAQAQLQQLAAANEHFLPQHLATLHHIAMASAAAMTTALQQREREQRLFDPGEGEQQNGEEYQELDECRFEHRREGKMAGDGEDRERSMDTLNGEEGLGMMAQFSSSGTSSASTTMHGDLVERGRKGGGGSRRSSRSQELQKMPTLFGSTSRQSGSSSSGSNGKEQNGEGGGGRSVAESKSYSNNGECSKRKREEGTSDDNSPSFGSSANSASQNSQTDLQVHCLLNQMNSVADRVENALKGHCKQLDDLFTSLHKEMMVADAKGRAQFRIERRRSEMFFHKYSKLRRQLQATAGELRRQKSFTHSRESTQAEKNAQPQCGRGE